jgi:hypothetical protein
MRTLWKFAASLFVVSFALMSGIGVKASNAVGLAAKEDPIALYGKEIMFDVFRENRRVGFHTVRFNREGDELFVNSRFELKIDVLFFTVYRFLYQSDAVWRGASINSLKVQVDDNGEAFRLSANRTGKDMSIRSSAGTTEFQGRLFPTNHWNSNVLHERRVLNTLTGQINRVRIEARQRERVPTERGEIEATRYAYTGELQTEVWYDDMGRWVKMRFAGRDGTPIDYVCQRCQGPSTKSAVK